MTDGFSGAPHGVRALIADRLGTQIRCGFVRPFLFVFYQEVSHEKSWYRHGQRQ